MTRDRAKKLLPIIQAFAEGKTIQFLSKQEQLDGKWLDVWYDCTNPTFSEITTYRIKPTDDNITYAKELIKELLLADTRNGYDWIGYLDEELQKQVDFLLEEAKRKKELKEQKYQEYLKRKKEFEKED